jgi:hypothetical protein
VNESAVVERVQLGKITKAIVVRLVNVSGGYVESTQVIAKFVRGRRVRE